MITSLQNTLVKEIVALRESKYRRIKGLTLIDGVREIQRASQAGIGIEHLVYCEKLFTKRGEKELIVKAKELNLPLLAVNDKVFSKIAFGERAEGVLAVAKTPQMTLAQFHVSKNPLLVVLESVEKPGNLGAILRSCDGAGVEAVLVCDPKTDMFNPNVIRASTGIVFSLPVIADTQENIAAFLVKAGVNVYLASPDGKCVYNTPDYRKPTAFVLGSEDKGLSQLWLTSKASQINIPMSGKADSLNVSVSTALLVYEALRQRAS